MNDSNSDGRKPQWELDNIFNEIVHSMKDELSEEKIAEADEKRTLWYRVGFRTRKVDRISEAQLMKRLRTFLFIMIAFPFVLIGFLPAAVTLGAIIAFAAPLYWILVGRNLATFHPLNVKQFWVFGVLTLFYILSH